MNLYLSNFIKVKINPKLFRATIKDFKRYLSIDDKSIFVSLISEQKMAAINKRYRGKKGATDCISFAYSETKAFPGKNIFGEIYLCPAYIQKQAKRHKNSFEKELKQVFIHSLLHLFGFDHKTEAEEIKMNEMAKKIF